MADEAGWRLAGPAEPNGQTYWVLETPNGEVRGEEEAVDSRPAVTDGN